MDTKLVYDILEEALFLVMKLSVPLMLIALVVGVGISIIQAATQIQETTVSFVPKLIAIFIGILLLAPLGGSMLSAFAVKLFGFMSY